MKTRRRFTAEYKAKVVLEALKYERIACNMEIFPANLESPAVY